MRRFAFGWLALAVVVLGSVPVAGAAVQNRIAGGAGKTVVALAQSISPRAMRSTDLGEAEGGTALKSITLHFSMTAAQRAALTQLLADQQNPASARYRQWLTPEQFADQFGLSAADVATVSEWATGHGFKIGSVARSRTFLQFSGTVAQAEAAFHTSIHRVTLDGESHIANVSAVSLPSGIAGVVEAVSGLNDFRVKPRVKVRQVQPRAGSSTGVNPAFTSSVSGNTYIAPGDFYTIYDVSPLLASSINGTGISIAVAGQTDIQLSDMAAFRSASGLSANPPVVKLYGADPGTPLTSGQALDETEADLDLEWSGAVAPAATIIYANSTDVFNSLEQIVDNDLAPIASISYGDCESGVGQPDLDTLNNIFMQANSQGQTIVGPAGDSGATDCDYQSATATQGLAVDFPASSPYVTGVGGTGFNEGTGTYFGTTNNANGGSALSYIPEEVWNTTATDGTLSAGGGGVSAYFSKPSWQTGTGVPADASRDVPDVSLNADPDHDGYLFCSQGSCVVGYRASANGNLSVVGGTSASTPSFAGILALVEQKIGARIGNANPVIYALANSTYYNTVFHDVQTGNNESPCTTGTPDCPTGGSIGYTAGVGYDLASGWGSVDAFNLANDWTLVTPGSVSGIGTVASSTTVTAGAASVTSGTSVTITATVASDVTTSTTVPTGTVQFLVDNVVSRGPVTLSGGLATFTLATAGLTAGGHTVSAAYSGDTTYAGSKGTVTVDVVSATAPDFTLTPATTTVTVAAGADAPGIVYTLTPVNGFTGPVSFTATTTSTSLNATYSFTTTPLQITSPTAGMTTLDLSAYVSGGPGAAQVNATPGTYNIVVTATGTSAGQTVTHSATVTFVVMGSSTTAGFTLSPATSTVTVASGADAPGIVYTVTSTGFTGPIALTASTTSSTLNATYSFTATPVQITSSSMGTTTLELSAYAKTGATGLARHGLGRAVVKRPLQSASSGATGWFAGSGASLACIVLLIIPRRRRMGALLGLVVSMAALGGMMGLQGCGGGSNNNPATSTQVNAAPGTYTIIVTATGTSAGTPVSQNATVTFVVQ